MSEELEFEAVVIAPTFNNARTLLQVLEGIDRVGLPVILINDGSTDETAKILEGWQDAEGRHTVLTHSTNRGKAAAMRSGFERALRDGYSHAVTIDTDGQLEPQDIPEMLRIARKSPGAIVVGCRDATAKDYPLANRLARIATNLFVRLESGECIPDSQCGFRVYPFKKIRSIRCRTGRYSYETEILTRAVWAGIPIEQATVQCRYELPEGRVSHFRPWLDSFACVKIHARLLLESMTRRMTDPQNSPAQGTPAWRRLLWWLSPIRAGRALRQNPAERGRFATGVAVGVFIANLPLYGVQTVLGLYAARRLRLNPVSVILGSSVSTPPVGPLLITMAISAGYWLLHGTLPDTKAFDPSVIGYRALIRSVLLEWAIGSILCGTILAFLAYLLTRALLWWLPVHTPEARADDPGEPVPSLDRAVAKSAA
jgi:uncharacterized protein (DUF2062 family)